MTATVLQCDREAAFQERVQPWLLACFGEMIAGDREERNHRFLEEALELVQACGCTASEAHQLVDYVFERPIGEPAQEVGGVMVTLAALCLANGLDMHADGETELARIWTKVEAIRAKQAAKPKHSPLPATRHDSTREMAEALEHIGKFVDDFKAPWGPKQGKWKTKWWAQEVSDDAAFTADNALMHVANIARKALATLQGTDR